MEKTFSARVTTGAGGRNFNSSANALVLEETENTLSVEHTSSIESECYARDQHKTVMGDSFGGPQSEDCRSMIDNTTGAT